MNSRAIFKLRSPDVCYLLMTLFLSMRLERYLTSSWGNERHTLESKGFRLSRSKTEYLRCEFNGVEGDGGEITLGGEAIPKVDKFKYLRSIIEKRRDMDDDINHRIRVG